MTVPLDWNNSKSSKLWLYNLHYFDDLNARDHESRRELHDWFIRKWIQENLPFEGNGWEPYVLSLRIVNLVKYYSRMGEKDEILLSSLAIQAQRLLQRPEYHILGNHLFANGKALTFAGAFFAGEFGEALLRKGLQILDKEIAEQFLADGGHFELSPMYQGILLWDLCDLINLAGKTGLPVLVSRSGPWRKKLEKGLEWLHGLSHPDGMISFFNDSAFGIAPKLEDLLAYADALGVKPNISSESWGHFRESGYVAIPFSEGGKLLVDVGEVGARYQPGHGHADLLSFELSLYGRRIFVNGGTSTYDVGPLRDWQRSSEAHNTLVLNRENSSEVWGGFRVGRRAVPKDLEISSRDQRPFITCAYKGFRDPSLVHQRRWEILKQEILIVDTVSVAVTSAVAYFHLHPDVEVVSVVDREVELRLKEGQGIFIVFSEVPSLLDSLWYPEFGVSKKNKCLSVKVGAQGLKSVIRWEVP